MCGDDFQPGGIVGGGYNRGGGRLLVLSTAAEPVSRLLASSQTEYLEGEADLGTTRENLEAGVILFDSLGKKLLGVSIGSAPLRGIDMGPQVFDGEETQGG